MGIVENLIKQGIEKKSESDYQRRLEELRPSFDAWIRAKETDLPTVDLSISEDGERPSGDSEYVTKYKGTSFRIVPMHKCGPGYSILSYIEDVIVFCNGELTDTAIPLMYEYFVCHSDCLVLTGDEDIAGRESGDSVYDGIHYGDRRNPYFKPDWSPGEFASHFYFCNIVAVRRIAIRSLNFSGEVTGAASIYHNLSKLIFANEYNARNCVGHINEIVIHAADYSNNTIEDEFVRESADLLTREATGETDLSVIILTKNNVPGLIKCLECLETATEKAGLSKEIIVIDDNSPEISRQNTVDVQVRFNFAYEHLTEETTESERRALGISKAKGRIVLLLSDRILFKRPEDLMAMYRMAAYKFSGVTGIKILRGETDRIVHAGLVITRLGLMYKLKGLSDLTEYGNGYNRFDRNVSAVSLDCAMFKRKLYEKAGGFSKDIPEAFKGADLCLRLMEAGFFNAVCNSLSVEAEIFDGEYSEEVILGRELSTAEKLRMTAMHPILKNNDPFYSKRLLRDNTDVRILPACEFEYERAVECTGKVDERPCEEEGLSEELHLEVEYAGTLADYLNEEAGEDLYIQGKAYIRGYNNACFLKTLLLRNGKISYHIPVTGCYRSDSDDTDSETTELLLSGVSVKIDRNSLEAGTYQIGMLMSGMFPKRRYVNYSDVYLVVNK